MTLTRSPPVAQYLLAAGDLSGPLVSDFSINSALQFVNNNQVRDVLDISISDLVHGGSTVHHIGLPNSVRLTDAHAVTVGHIDNLSINYFPLTGNDIGVSVDGPILGGIRLTLHSQSGASYTYLNAVPRFYVDDSCTNLQSNIVVVADTFVKHGGGHTFYLKLDDTSCAWPDTDETLVSRSMAVEYIDCMMSKLATLGEIIVEQKVNKLVNANAVLDVEFAINYQSVGGGSCTGIDYPFSLIVDYTNRYGKRNWVHHFYYDQWGTVTEPHTKVCRGWNNYQIKLSDIDPDIVSIETLYMRAAGAEFYTLVDQLTLTVCDQQQGTEGIVQLSQTIVEQEMSCDSNPKLELDLKIVKQDALDIPLQLVVYYGDEQGQHQFVRKFTTVGQTIGETVLIEPNKWVHQALDLTTICPCIKNVYKVVLQGIGYDYDAYIDNVRLTTDKKVIPIESPTRPPVAQNVVNTGTTSQNTDTVNANTKNSLVDLANTTSSTNTSPLSNITGIPPITNISRVPATDKDIGSTDKVMLSADVKIDAQDKDTSRVPLSIVVDYDSEQGPQQHTVNISTVFNDNYYAAQALKSISSTDCSGQNYWSNKDCPGYSQLVNR